MGIPYTYFDTNKEFKHYRVHIVDLGSENLARKTYNMSSSITKRKNSKTVVVMS